MGDFKQLLRASLPVSSPSSFPMHVQPRGCSCLYAGALIVAALPHLPAQTTLIDFSNYSIPTTVANVTRAGTTLTADVPLLTSGGTDSLLRFRGSTGNIDGAAFSATTVDGPALRVTDSSTNGQVFAMVQSIDPFNLLSPADSLISYSVSFTIKTIGTDRLNFGFYNADVFNYSQTNAQAKAVLAFQMGGGKVSPIRNGAASNLIDQWAFSAPQPGFTGTTVDASAPSFAANTLYTATITMNTASGGMTLSLYDVIADTYLFSIAQSVAEVNSAALSPSSTSGYNYGDVRFSFGETENNTGRNWSFDILQVEYGIIPLTPVPEPSTLSLLIGATGLLWVSRRRFRGQSVRH